MSKSTKFKLIGAFMLIFMFQEKFKFNLKYKCSLRTPNFYISDLNLHIFVLSTKFMLNNKLEDSFAKIKQNKSNKQNHTKNGNKNKIVIVTVIVCLLLYCYCYFLKDRSPTREESFGKPKKGNIKTILENPGSPPGPGTSGAWKGPGTEPGIGYKKQKIQKNNKTKNQIEETVDEKVDKKADDSSGTEDSTVNKDIKSLIL